MHIRQNGWRYCGLSHISLAISLSVAAVIASPSAFAQSATPSADQLKALQDQINAQQQQIQSDQAKLKQLQTWIESIKTQQAQAAPAGATAVTAPAPTPASNGLFNHGVLYKSSAVNLIAGGFIEAAGIERDRNETADVGSVYRIGTSGSVGGGSGIPLPISNDYHESEFRGSSRQSRLSLLAQGQDDYKTLSAYFETDFLGQAATANSNESNSYNLRIRHIYATYDDNEDGWHILGGQTWSLLTMNKVGIIPRQENIPLTIDAQYAVGFNWARQPQIRFVKDFGKELSAGISFENPAVVAYNGGGYLNTASSPGFGPVQISSAGSGGGLLNGGGAFSLDEIPDIVGKVAYDPGWGHYEAYGITRFFHDRQFGVNSGANHDTNGWGGGVGMILPIVPKMVDFQISGLAGYGIGRYGSGQFQDAVVSGTNGELVPIPEVEALVGVIAHPTHDLDLYLYGGDEHAWAASVATVGGKLYGYGNPSYVNSGCNIEDSALGCVANMQNVWQIQGGEWWKFYQGNAGMMEWGLSDSYTRASTFSGVGGAPSVGENIIMTSFRYYPF